MTDALLQQVPSVFINDTSVNPFQPDVQYRGFMASPTVGVPQGLAVYQNGVRINEAFGDTVNWDFIPEYAIRRLDVFPSNPIFGLNALGGAISIEMKNGFNYQGREIELLGGSFWRRSVGAQVGMQKGNTSFYVAADALNDNGWRDRSQSELRRIYADVGILGERTEFHVNFTGASNFFGAAAATPIELLNRDWSAVYTTPQTYKNQLAFLNATGSYPAQRHAYGQGQCLLPRFLAEARRRQHQRRRAMRPGAVPGFLCFDEDDNLLFGLERRPVPRYSQRRYAGLDRSHRDGGEQLRRLSCRRPARHGVRPQQPIRRSARASIAAACSFKAVERARHDRPRPVRHRHRRHHQASRTARSRRPTSRPAIPITDFT